MESGEVLDDPCEDLLFELLTDIDRGEVQSIIVERLADPTGQTYAQAIKNRDRLLNDT